MFISGGFFSGVVPFLLSFFSLFPKSLNLILREFWDNKSLGHLKLSFPQIILFCLNLSIFLS